MRTVYLLSYSGFFATFMFLFHIIIIIVVYFAVPAPQNSRRLTGNWREVSIYVHVCKKAVGFDATNSCICLLFIFIMKEFSLHMFVLCFSKDVCLCVLLRAYNAALQQFPLPLDC